MIEYVVRVDGDGTKWWYQNGRLHCEDGPAVEWASGSRHWCQNGKLHREDGPAIEWADGDKIWYRNGKIHREDGPAIERVDGSKAWYVDGINYSEKDEFKKKINPVQELTLTEISRLLGYEVKVIKG